MCLLFYVWLGRVRHPNGTLYERIKFRPLSTHYSVFEVKMAHSFSIQTNLNPYLILPSSTKSH